MTRFLLKQAATFDIFNLSNSVALYYLFSYLFPILVAVRIRGKLVNPETASFDWGTALFIAVGITSLILGYFLSRKIKFPPSSLISSFLSRPWNLKNGILAFSFIFLANLFVKFMWVRGGAYFHLRPQPISISDSFYSLWGSLGPFLAALSVALAFIFYFFLLKSGDERYKFWRVVAWVVFSFEFLYAFFASERYLAVVPIVTYLIIRHYLFRKSFWRPVIAGTLIVFVLFPVMNFYKAPGNFFRGYMFGERNGIPDNAPEISKYVIDSSVGRISQYPVLHYTFASSSKFLYGKDLLNFFISLGPPRFLWKNKPIINPDGNALAREIGLLPETNKTTTIGFTVLGDWYINFGWPGVVFGMAFMGFLFGLLYSLLIKKNGVSLTGLLIYVVFWPQIVEGTENFIAPVYAGLVKNMILLLLIIYFFFLRKNEVEPAK